MAIDIQWIGDNASLAQHCATWRTLAFVAVDTEFMRVDTFSPIAGRWKGFFADPEPPPGLR